MRYSEIIGSKFYCIRLTQMHTELVDAYYLAAAHHRARFLKADSDKNLCDFHFSLFAQHVFALLRTIAAGNFTEAKDPLCQGLERSEGWYKPWFQESMQNILRCRDIRVIELDILPDSGMFDEFPADKRFKIGESHHYDYVLERPDLVRHLTAALCRKDPVFA